MKFQSMNLRAPGAGQAKARLAKLFRPGWAGHDQARRALLGQPSQAGHNRPGQAAWAAWVLSDAYPKTKEKLFV